jgi:hypothetical protein
MATSTATTTTTTAVRPPRKRRKSADVVAADRVVAPVAAEHLVVEVEPPAVAEHGERVDSRVARSRSHDRELQRHG